MLAKQVARAARGITMRAASLRSCSSDALVRVEPSGRDGVKVLRMQRQPVNSLSQPFLEQFVGALDELDADKSVQGVVIASDCGNVFSAGLDLSELYQRDAADMRRFWNSLQDMFFKLYGSRFTTVAAIGGHAPAGGCMLSLCCDYRVMASGGFRIGLNETQLGIVAPFWFVELYRRVLGDRQSERMLQLGSMISAEEALSLGMVDEVVEQEETVQRAVASLKPFLKVPPMARHESKLALRRPLLDRLAACRDKDTDNFVNFVSTEPVQKGLGKYLASLSKKADA